MPLELNDLETARFGIICARLTEADTPLADVNVAAATANVRMITTRVDVSALDRVHALEADGYRLMDTLVYYARPLKELPAAPALPEGVSLRFATPADAPRVAEVAREAFRGYFGHYHADPGLDNAAADAAYMEWAETSTRRCGPEAPVLLAFNASSLTGFLTLRRNASLESEIILNAVSPKAQGGGLYSALVHRALQEEQVGESERMLVSTQINNYAVQRIWTRLGFSHCHSLYTFHKWLAA